MTKWTKKDVFLTVSINLLAALIAFAIAGSGLSFSVYALFFVPLAFTAVLAWLLNKRGRRVRFLAALLALLDGLLLVALMNSNGVTRMIDRLTGYYNVEAITFLLAIPLCYGLGLLIGLGLGSLLAQPGKRG